MIHTEMGERPFTGLAGSVYGSKADINKLVLGDQQYPWGTAEIIRKIQHMVETRTTPSELDDMIEAIAVIEAFRQSSSTGQLVKVSDYLHGS